MRIDVFSIFPEMVEEFAQHSLLDRAREQNHVDLRCHDLRGGATDRHRSVDDEPYGGGAGMVLAAAPVFAAVEAVNPPRPLIALSPRGVPFDQSTAESLATLDGFSLLCGRYEGLDERIHSQLCDRTISIGDMVLAGGEVAAMVIIEAVTRLVPGVMGNDQSGVDESFADGLLEYPLSKGNRMADMPTMRRFCLTLDSTSPIVAPPGARTIAAAIRRLPAGVSALRAADEVADEAIEQHGELCTLVLGEGVENFGDPVGASATQSLVHVSARSGETVCRCSSVLWVSNAIDELFLD
ncbi:MAG: tRNA (guanosine(37)-N1)-methyltransferase TrmD [Acidobacteria bacterium]|nr:tRNA (guanosine(37)-N1)-methyltransferase TrmD [Acidobacteriota bacterium]